MIFLQLGLLFPDCLYCQSLHRQVYYSLIRLNTKFHSDGSKSHKKLIQIEAHNPWNRDIY